MGKGPSTPDTQTVKNEPWSGVQEYLRNTYGQTDQAMGTPLEFFPGQTYADMSPWTQQSMTNAQDFIEQMFPQVYGQGMSNLSTLSNAVDVGNNPYVQAMNAQTARSMSNAASRNIGELGNTLGNNLQNFGLASSQATDAFGRQNANAIQDYGLASNQAIDSAGRMLNNQLGRNALQNQYDTSMYSRAMDNSMGDFRVGFNEAMGDVTRQLQNEWLPGIRSGAGLAGQYGGSRQGVAEGLAMGNAAESLSDWGAAQSNAIGQMDQAHALGLGNVIASNSLGQSQATGDVAANIANMVSNQGRDVNQMFQAGSANTGNLMANLGRDYSQSYGAGAIGMGNAIGASQDALGNALTQTNLGAYGQGLNALNSSMQYIPQMASLGLMPSQVYGQIGETAESWANKPIQEQMQRWDFYQNEPWDRLANANAIYTGASPYSSQTTTAREGDTSNPWVTAGALGMGAYGMFA